jgi:hypothetical protein
MHKKTRRKFSTMSTGVLPDEPYYQRFLLYLFFNIFQKFYKDIHYFTIKGLIKTLFYHIRARRIFSSSLCSKPGTGWVGKPGGFLKTTQLNRTGI